MEWLVRRLIGLCHRDDLDFGPAFQPPLGNETDMKAIILITVMLRHSIASEQVSELSIDSLNWKVNRHP